MKPFDRLIDFDVHGAISRDEADEIRLDIVRVDLRLAGASFEEIDETTLKLRIRSFRGHAQDRALAVSQNLNLDDATARDARACDLCEI